MIPKIIHYCRFGKKVKDKLSVDCIKTWKKNLKAYDFVEWNESNFDVTANVYVKAMYEAGLYAFVADYARFYVLNTKGGIYLDTDVEVYKSFDPFLDCKAFTSFEGAHTEARPMLEMAVMGSEPHGKWVCKATGDDRRL